MTPERDELPEISETGEPDSHLAEKGVHPLSPGDLVGDFEVLEEVGRGGMGIVYKAYERSLKRVVALKVLHPRISENPSSAKRFRQEAVMAANLTHANIVPVFQVDQGESPRYFTMEFVQGRSIRELVEKDGFMRPAKAVAVILQTCEALEYAHQHSIIHRDIKPSNILLQNHLERVRITDFGIAQDVTGKLADGAQSERTAAGTPAFMSPEQNLGHPLDQRTDVYSLGVTLYYMLTGWSPYRARTRAELAVATEMQSVAPPSSLNPEVGKALDAVVLKMIEADPKNRYPDCATVAADLQRTLTPPKGLPSSLGAGRRFAGVPLRYAFLLFVTFTALLIGAVTWFFMDRESGRRIKDNRAAVVAGFDVVCETDFSSDPGWTTNAPENFHWDETAGNYYFKRQNGSEQYSYKSIPYDPDASYRLEFDVFLTRCDWAASFFLSLSDPDMHIASATTWQVSYHNVDQGKSASLIYFDSEGGSYGPGGAQPAPFELNTWYHNVVVCDPSAGTLSLRVTRVSDGLLVGGQELTGVGSFAGVNRLSISAVGHKYASGAIAEGYVDNLVLKSSALAAQPPVATQFAIDGGAAATESRTVNLNNTTENNPMDYMASESSKFTGAAWKTYSTAPQFTLSDGDGQKTVHFKTKNATGESTVVHDSIILRQAPPIYRVRAFLPAWACYSADLSPDGSVIYASAHLGDSDEGVRLYDASTCEHIKDIHAFPDFPKYILASADGIHLYATAYYQGAVAKIRVSDGAVVKNISVGPWPVGMVFDSARRYLYVMVNCPHPGAVGSILIIDTSTDTVAGTIGPIVHAGTVLAISPDDQYLYALSFDDQSNEPQTLYKMTIADHSVQAVPGVRVGGISVSPGGQLLYVADRFAGAVRVFQTSAMTETTCIPVTDVHGFWIAPSGDHGLAVCLAPGSGELLIHVIGLPKGEILQTLSQTLKFPDGFSSRPLVDPVFWNRATGEALIPVFREHGGVVALSPAEEPWQLIYQTDFSAEPEWITDQPNNYYWNESAGTYHATSENNAPDHQPSRYCYTQTRWTGNSFELRWDLNMTRIDWSGGIAFGLWDENITPLSGSGYESVYVEFGYDDSGPVIHLSAWGADGVAHNRSAGGAYAANVWYTCKISYDAPANEVRAEVVASATGTPVWSTILSVPGGFTKPLVKLGHSWSGFGLTGGYSGVNRWAEADAEFDNVVLKRPDRNASLYPLRRFRSNAVQSNARLSRFGNASRE